MSPGLCGVLCDIPLNVRDIPLNVRDIYLASVPNAKRL